MCGFYKNDRNKCVLDFDEMNISILLDGRLVDRKHGCDKWGCKGKGNLSDGKVFFHKTNLLQPLQLSENCYADKSAIYSYVIGLNIFLIYTNILVFAFSVFFMIMSKPSGFSSH